MKKRILSISIILCMLSTIFTGCGSSGGNSSAGSTASGVNGNTTAADNSATTAGNSTTTAATDGKMPNLVVLFPYNDIPADLKLVEAEINRMIKDKIGCTIELQGGTYGNMIEKQTLILASPTEQMDLIMAMYRQGFHGPVSQGQLRPLNDLVEQYGPQIKENIEPNAIVNCSIEGTLYGIQPNRELAVSRGFVLRKDIVDELGLQLPERVTDFNQMTPIFQQIHEAYPDMYILASSSPKDGRYNSVSGVYDELTDGLGVLMDMNDPTVTNLYETEEYRTTSLIMQEWNKAGYIYPDILIDGNNNGSQLMRNGTLACYYDTAKPGAESEKKVLTGYEVVVVPMGNPVFVTNTNWSWVVPENSVYPEKAIEFVNLLFSDEELINLLCYGIKGTHWDFDADGFVIDGPNSAGYADKKNWATGNGYIAGVMLGNPKDLGAQLKAFNQEAKASKALGFLFDIEKYTAEYTALQNVLAEHRTALMWGFTDDVDQSIKDMNDALYAAGLDTYIKAKQEQLNAWMEANGR